MEGLPSTVPDAKAGLLALLRARPALQGVQVEWSHPGKGIELETVYLGNVENHQQRAAALGNRERRETYDLELIVTVESRGNEPEATERRCWALLNEVAAVLRDDPELAAAVEVAQYAASPVRNFVGAGKRVAESVVVVSCEATV